MSRTDYVLITVALACVVVWSLATPPYDLVLTLVGVLIGGLISGLISWFYYQRASEDLREEARRLRIQTKFIMNALEAGNPIEFVRDEQTGEIVGNAYKGDAVVRKFLLEASEQSPGELRLILQEGRRGAGPGGVDEG